MQVLLLVAPVFGVILTGFVAVRLRIVDEAITGWLIAFAYKICLPALMITIMAQAKIAELLDRGFWIAFGGATLVVLVAVLALGGRRFGPGRGALTVAALAASFTNAGFVALPVLHHVFGARGVPPAAIANLIVAGLMFPLAIVLLELCRGEDGRRRPPLAIARQVVTNPMVWSTLLGFVLAATGIALPGVLDDFLTVLGNGLTPAALFAVGASIRLADLVHEAPRLVVLSAIKLVVMPVIALGLALALDLAPIWAVGAVICAAVPTAKNVLVLAEQFDTGQGTAAMTISATTLGSIVTLTLWFLLLAQIWPSAFAHVG